MQGNDDHRLYYKYNEATQHLNLCTFHFTLTCSTVSAATREDVCTVDSLGLAYWNTTLYSYAFMFCIHDVCGLTILIPQAVSGDTYRISSATFSTVSKATFGPI